MVVAFGSARGGRAETGPFAVGGWIAAGPIALPAKIVLAYVPAEVAGALLALPVITVAHPLHPVGGRSATGHAITSTELLP